MDGVGNNNNNNEPITICVLGTLTMAKAATTTIAFTIVYQLYQ